MIVGLADFHNHQFAHLGFGQSLFSHSPNPNDPCLAILPSSISFRVSNVVRKVLLEEASKQAEAGQCYPTADNKAGQQVDDESLRRAVRGGLRLMVVLALNSEFLCIELGLNTTNCKDKSAIDRQLTAAHDMEARIDAEAGGPGLGWYQVVETPEEARQVISEDKLAVVLGVEAAGAFDCGVQHRGAIDAVRLPGEIGNPGQEETWRTASCPGHPDHRIPGLNMHKAMALFEHYWNQGARHFFPIHTFDNLIGGAGVSTPLLHGQLNPTRRVGGIVLPELERVIRDVRPPFESFSCSSFEFEERCNTRGLTDVGKVFIEHLGSYGAIIDLDHMSLIAKRNVIDTLGAQYATVASHAGASALNHRDKDNEIQVNESDLADMLLWDGSVAPILRPADATSEQDAYPPGAPAGHGCGGTVDSFIQAYRYFADQVRAAERQITYFFQPEQTQMVGIGFGSDFNGLAGWPEPRFRPVDPPRFDPLGTLSTALIGVPRQQPPPGGCYEVFGDGELQPGVPRVEYPFTLYKNGEIFDRSELPWSGRTEPYDINRDGFAHIGMLPDFIQEMRAVGVTEEELEPLWHGAEAYIRTWEAASRWQNAYSEEDELGIQDTCRTLRAQLLETRSTPEQSFEMWGAVVDQLNAMGCKGS